VIREVQAINTQLQPEVIKCGCGGVANFCASKTRGKVQGKKIKLEWFDVDFIKCQTVYRFHLSACRAQASNAVYPNFLPA